MWEDFDVRDNRRWTYSLEEELLWIMDFSRKQWFEVKKFLMIDLFILSSQYINWWTGVVWIIVMFLLDSHYDGTHSLQRIHFWASDAMLHFSKSDDETNASTWAEVEQILGSKNDLNAASLGEHLLFSMQTCAVLSKQLVLISNST